MGMQTFPDSWAPAVRTVGEKYRLRVWVKPGSSRSRVDGLHGDSVKVRVTAPPERGKANRAVEKLLSGALGMRAQVVSGHTSRRKEVEFTRRRDSL